MIWVPLINKGQTKFVTPFLNSELKLAVFFIKSLSPFIALSSVIMKLFETKTPSTVIISPNFNTSKSPTNNSSSSISFSIPFRITKTFFF